MRRGFGDEGVIRGLLEVLDSGTEAVAAASTSESFGMSWSDRLILHVRALVFNCYSPSCGLPGADSGLVDIFNIDCSYRSKRSGHEGWRSMRIGFVALGELMWQCGM